MIRSNSLIPSYVLLAALKSHNKNNRTIAPNKPFEIVLDFYNPLDYLYSC
jgi:hypothetical protein